MPLGLRLFSGPDYTGPERLDGKTVIVTGSNAGIGKETARELARRGARVVLACRDLTRAEAAKAEIVKDTGNEDIVCRCLDLASFKSIHAFSKEIHECEPRLDILINNAGVLGKATRSLTEDGLEMVFGVNHCGHFLLTSLLLDMLKASTPSRIIILSSILHSSGNINLDDLNSELNYDSSPRGTYADSKLANLLHMRGLVKRLEGSGVTVNSVHPGTVDTTLFNNASLPVRVVVGICRIGFKSPHNGAQTTLRLALDDSLKNVTGCYFKDSKEIAPSMKAQDDNMAEKLWDASERLTKIKIEG